MPKLAQILEQSSGTRQVCVSVFFLFWSLYKANRFHGSVGLFSDRSQKTSKCGKTAITDTLACGSCATSLFLPHFDVFCDLLLNRHTATWNLFVKLTHDITTVLQGASIYKKQTRRVLQEIKDTTKMNVIIHVRLMHTERTTTKARLKKCAM